MADPDDGSCEDYEEASKCLEEKSILSSHTSKCAWDEETATCSFRDLGGDIYRVMMVALIVAVIGTPFALASEALICNILAAETVPLESKKKISSVLPVVRVPSNKPRATVLMLKRVETMIGSTAENDYRILNKDIQEYRSSLTQKEKLDFDGQYNCLS